MAGRLSQSELLKLFPVKTLPSVAHGRSRAKKRKVAKGVRAHGRSRGGSLPTAATRDPWGHKAQAKGQG